MAVIADPNIATNVTRVGMGPGMVWTPEHVASGPLPIGTGGAYRISMQSGTMAAALAGGSEIFQFRYVTANSRTCLIHGISVSAGANVAATAAGLENFRVTLARSWTVAGSGGTRASLTGHNQKLRTAHASSEVDDIGISTTGALTAGTKTLDANDICSIALGIGTGAITTGATLPICAKTNLFGDFNGGLAFPIVLANQEGFVVRIGAAAWPATMTWGFAVDVAWSEVTSF